MKKKMLVRELKEYCSKHKLNGVLFDSYNQDWYHVSNPVKIKMCFSIMLIYENPNLICLKSKECTMSIDQVECVEIDTEEAALGVLLQVHCPNITYTLIMS
jgi:hypothetical protein